MDNSSIEKNDETSSTSSSLTVPDLNRSTSLNEKNDEPTYVVCILFIF